MDAAEGRGTRAAVRGVWWIVGTVVAASVGLAVFVDVRMGAVERRLEEAAKKSEEIERVLQLYRFEQTSTAGLGIDALLEKLAYWAPQLERAGTPAAELPAIRKYVEDVLAAVKGLGAEAYPAVMRKFEATKARGEDELRKWLGRAAYAADRVRGKELWIDVLRGLQFPVSQRLREVAADELLELDRATAGRLLREILGYESSSGIDERRIPREYVERYPDAVYAHAGHRPGFFNFVSRYVASGDPASEETLIMLLGRHEQDLMTVQECVKELGRLRSRAAVEKIQKLYAAPPAIQQNTIFQRHCLEAVGQILEREACDWFAQVQRSERDEVLAAKLVELRQRYCQ